MKRSLQDLVLMSVGARIVCGHALIEQRSKQPSVIAMPFKHNPARRHRIGKMKFKVTNWREYEAGLRRRGSLTLWMTAEALSQWKAVKRTTRGGQPRYSGGQGQSVFVEGDENGIRAQVSDAGPRIIEADIAEYGKRLGLVGLRWRFENIRGAFTVSSKIGGGTTAYRKNVSFRAFAKDIKDVFWLGQTMARQKVEIVVGSPPCQDFSTVGRRREGLNARLTHAYAMLVAIARPEWFLMENVPDAARSKPWKESRAILVRQGYGLTEMILNAKDYGTPQSRKRLIVVGRLGERNGFLSSSLTDAASAKSMTVRDILRPDEFPEDRALLDIMYYYMRPFSGNSGVFSIDRPSPTIIRTATAPPGDTYLKNPHPKDPFPVAQAHVMTREQVSRLQGFPAGWDWSLLGNKNNVEQGIANAVPPPLAESVGRVILARHHGETIPAVESGFVEWLCQNGKSERAASNVRANVNRARKLLGGRTYADPASEMGRLELAEGFGALPTQTKSDLRSALRLHAEWQAGHP